MGAEAILEAHFIDCENTMEALFLSGFTVAHDTIFADIMEQADKSRQLGLADLADKLTLLKGGMDELRHSLNRDNHREQELIKLYCHINKYLSLGIKKCRYDRVREGLKEALQEEM